MDQDLSVDTHQEDTIGELFSAATELLEDAFMQFFRSDAPDEQDVDEAVIQADRKALAARCSMCSQSYTQTNRREQCFKCKKYICEDCSPWRMHVDRDSPDHEKQRVCKPCMQKLQNKLS